MTTFTLYKKWFVLFAFIACAQAPSAKAVSESSWVKSLQDLAGKAQEKAGKWYDNGKKFVEHAGQKLGKKALVEDTEATIATSPVGKCVGYCQARFEGFARYVKNHKAGCVITAVIGATAVYAVYKSIKYVAKKASTKTAPANNLTETKPVTDEKNNQ